MRVISTPGETQTSDQAVTSNEVDNDTQPNVDESALDSSGGLITLQRLSHQNFQRLMTLLIPQLILMRPMKLRRLRRN